MIVAADTSAARSIVKMKSDEDKTKVLSPHLLMSYSGEPGLWTPVTPHDASRSNQEISFIAQQVILSNLPNTLKGTSDYSTCGVYQPYS